MKKGMILYLTEGKDEIDDWQDLTREKNRLHVDEIRLATSEAELTYSWWQMLVRGMQHVSCVRASFDGAENRIKMEGQPLRLCG